MKRLTSFVLAGLVGIAACSDNIPTTSPKGALQRAQGTAAAREDDFVPGQIIVRFRPGAARSEVAEAHRAHKKDDMRLERMEILEVPEGEELAIAEEMSKNPNVEFAEPDYIMRVGPCEVATVGCNLPDGSFWPFKWDLHNTGSFVAPAVQPGLLVTTGKPDADIDWGELYDRLGANFAGTAVIGMLDTGIRSTHNMFVGKIIAGMRFLNDGQPVTNFADDHGHGSHTAGIAAGRAVSASAVPGVGYGQNIKLLIAKVCNAAGSCPSSATANAIVWATDNGANVINMSLGSFGGNPDGSGSAAQQAALIYAASKNVLPVCATGNDDNKPGNGYVGGVAYPGRFSQCMAVAASDWNDTKASYSNYGAQVAVSAPGGDGELSPYSLIMSASASGNTSYAFNAGTSMATPQVAGLAALLFASGMTDANAVRQRIIETADDLEAPGWDPRTGAGRINVYRAVTGVSPNAPPVANPGAAYSSNKGIPVQFDGTASFDPNGKAITWAWNFGDPASASNTSTLSAPSHTYLRAGNYTVTLTVTDASNRATTSTVIAAIPNIVPAVSLGGGTILAGETFEGAGLFTDADPDSWTASVSYGDGSATQTLALSATKTFALSHRYMDGGDHTVAVTVSDNDNGNGVGTAVVHVSTAQEAIQRLLLDTFGTGATAELSDGRINAMGAPLRAAQASLDRGNSTPAGNQVNAFINHVQGMVRGGQISAEAGNGLIATANRILASINR